MTDIKATAPSCASTDEPHADDARPARRLQSEQIYALLRDRICLLHYAPGEMLREAELAHEFGVSRTPIREVLQRLAIGGLVEVRNGVGTIVTSLDLDELEDVYEMRLQVSMLIGRMNPRAPTAADIAVLEGLLGRAQALQSRFELKEYWLINHELHRLVASFIGNRSLREQWDNLYFKAARVWYEIARGFAGDAAAYLLREIEEVLRAVGEGDMEALGYVQRNYIAYGLRRVREWHQVSGGARPSGG